MVQMLWLWMIVGCGWWSDGGPAPRTPKEKAERRRERHAQIVLEGDEIGGRRSAWIHAPEDPRGPLPVVLSFHGGKGNSGRDMVPRWQHLFDEPVLFVFPNGQTTDRDEAGWTGVGRPAPGGDEMRDVRFVLQLLDALEARYPVDTARVYVTGHSNGGQMTWNLVCAHPERFAGFGVVSKPVPKALVERCDIGRKVPMIYFNGTADHDTWNEGAHTLSAEATAAWWVRKIGCAATPDRVTEMPDLGDRTRVTKRSYACGEGAAAEFFVIEGGGHAWPSKERGGGKDTCHDVDASEEMIRFFKGLRGM